MNSIKNYEIWFVTGSQHLYGEETLNQVADHSKIIAEGLNKSTKIPLSVVYKPIVTTSEEIVKVCREANIAENCAGIITWMHTFSPAKMWIGGLSELNKPFLHLHTQFNREIPWKNIDMDFMNLNQSAHGGREFGFIGSRLRINRTVVPGYWEDDDVQEKVGRWTRVAGALQVSRSLKVARFGDNMREVAVTEGNKVSAQIQLGWTVHGYGIGDLVTEIDSLKQEQIDAVLEAYYVEYNVVEELLPGGSKHNSLVESARIEAGMRSFLKKGGFEAFTDTFENLHGLKQLPGLPVQRLMRDGYGFGGEGDWKTAALVRVMKAMAEDLPGGTSFMEDYTYHLQSKDSLVLGAHMLEVCESIADGKPSLEIHPLGIGGKEDPVRSVFNVSSGSAVNASLIDMGNRFRLLVNPVDALKPEEALPRLPVARVLWKPRPDLETSSSAWILAGGAHHTVYSMALGREYLEIFAEMCGIEYLLIDENTTLRGIKQEINWNEVYFHTLKPFNL